MKIVVASLALSLIVAAPASAMCVGSENLSSCFDESGNSYTIQRMGNTTYLNGTNSRTGSNWSQQSTTLGSSTFHNGVDQDGNNWSTTCTNGFCY